MPLVLVERKNWIIYQKEAEDRNEIEAYLRTQFGFLPVFVTTEVTCKVCEERMSGYDGIKHLQTKSHIQKREELSERIMVLHHNYCDGCPVLMEENNSYENRTELACRLGYAYRDFDVEGIPIIEYAIDDDLTRPKKCIVEGEE